MSRTIYLVPFLVSVLSGACANSAPPRQPSQSIKRIDSQNVPSDLRVLIPLAEEWGIGDDGDRDAKIKTTTRPDRARLRASVAPYYSRITEWLDSFGEGTLSEEAAAFMYMQLALEEMPDP